MYFIKVTRGSRSSTAHMPYMNVIKFSQREFHSPGFKEFNNVWEKEEGSRSFIKIQILILYSFVQRSSSQIIINKNHKVLKMHSNYLLNKNQHCVSMGNNENSSNHFLANHKQILVP